MRPVIHAVALGLLISGAAADPVDAQDDMRIEDVRFDAGTTGTTIRDTITGWDSTLYRIGAEAGQTMAISLTATTNQTYFSVYGPGSGPGDTGLASSDLISPMVPDLNRFRGDLPQSGVYSVLVYQMRSAARRGLRSDYALDISVLGSPGEVVSGDFGDGLRGGPDFWAVQTAAGGNLNIRSGPSTGDSVVTMVPDGTVLRNLGCRMSEGRRWCEVETVTHPILDGWAAGQFLIEGAAPDLSAGAEAAEGNYDRPVGGVMPEGSGFTATGLLPCRMGMDQPRATCEFGVVREGGGNGFVLIFRTDGGIRAIFYQDGAPVAYDQSEADGGAEMIVTREDDTHIVTIGDLTVDIPDAAIFGG